MLALGVIFIAAGAWMALASPTPNTTDHYGFNGNPCDGAIVQAFAGSDAIENASCTPPARRQLMAAGAAIVVGTGAMILSWRRRDSGVTAEPPPTSS